ncbi:MAG: hypothetical protein A2756_05550 [Candidatus Ryanbacteria bacterium RIFCSPHIGHO2_01_FULL_48_27]|uniref:Type 4a pilus biogenesis protein PilO n=1 Tax=Candidatus Ryanbacteria bacterium RIFCSPHIGHO2_01_FULL_48_27 TaxID=1802115 RepID=A0A1G2G3B2_9BACT|nr:MAG: hypothetical protein A2756_05550 [Candidatus Ryanbacteria bacterium RIFCSPHIGHO2_01_FULL_48_27]
MNTAKNKFIAVIVLGITILTGIVVSGGLPIFSQIQESNQSLLATHQELASLERKEELLRNLERTVTDLAPDIEKIERTFFKPNEVVNFIVALESAAASSGVELSINNADLNKPAVNEQPTSSFALTARGSFTQIYRFIVLVENMPFNMEFTNVSLLGQNNTNGSAPSASSVQASIDLKVLTSAN